MINDFISRISGKHKRLLELREQWANYLNIQRDFKLIGVYHNLVSQNKNIQIIDDKTWADLNMDQLFSQIDNCTSAIGRQYLYHLMRIYENNEYKLKNRFSQYKLFIDNQQFREDMQLQLLKLKDKNASFISYLIWDKLPDKPKFYYLLYLTSFMSIASLFLTFIIIKFMYAAIAFAIINIIINKNYGRKIYDYFTGMAHLNIMLGVAERISKFNSEDSVPQLSQLKENIKHTAKLRKNIGWLALDKSKLNDLSGLLIEYLNIFCLFDIIAFIRSINDLRHYQKNLATIYEAIASLDASISIASYLTSLNYYSTPEFNSENRIDVTGIYHPLLIDAVSNDYQLDQKSCLITGSNMAGKTTFIKTIGINCILAQTLYFCHAKTSIIPKLFVKTSIKREDNLDEGKSYYLVEVEEILTFIQKNDSNNNYLFVIDEIFRGTNTLERLSASTSVLKYLSKGNIVLVTTHDIELQELLKNEYNMFHFSEQVSDDVYYFDYKIQTGPCSSRNAIKLLELTGYPEIITKEAYSLTHILSNKKGDL